MFKVSMKQLLEAGVHFGHQANRWNPKMKRYIFIERNGIHIIDLQKTLRLFKEAYQFTRDIASEGGTIIFTGTKKQAQDVIYEESQRCNMPYINNRWLGGMLTNFYTIKRSLNRLKKLEDMKREDDFGGITKKEKNKLDKKLQKMDKVLCGIKEMEKLPNAVFIADTKKERIAINEANKLEIPVIAIVDTNSDPEGIDFPIPGNDDAIRSIKLIVSTIAEAVIEGQNEWLVKRTEEEEEQSEQVEEDIKVEKVMAEKKELSDDNNETENANE